MIIDFHTHAFPDTLAGRAIPHLEAEGDITAYLDGTVSSLIRTMDETGIDASVVASIATKPEQFSSILRWSLEIATDRIIPFPSIHPADVSAVEQISEIKQSGLKGVKLHPYYQEFSLREDRIKAIVARIEREGLVLLLHTGFDLAFDMRRIADPEMISEVLSEFPGLKLVATHYGAWEDWDEAEKYLIGRDVYIDTSFSFPYLGVERAAEFLNKHPDNYVLFGSDSPWGSQRIDLQIIDSFRLSDGRKAKLFGVNAMKLLGVT